MPSGQNRRQAKNDKREAILQAAWKLIRHYGYNKTTIEDIAQEAGVGKGTAYLYFKSKSEIMLSITELTNDRITADLERIAGGPGSPEERVRACVLHRIVRLFDIVQKSPHGAEVISSMLPEIVERLDRYVACYGELFGKLLREGAEAGDLDIPDPRATGRLLADLFEFLTPPYYRFKSRRTLERFAGEVLDVVFCGLRRHGAGKDEARP